MDHYDDQYLADNHEPLGIPFDEEAAFFHPEEVQDTDEFQSSQQVEESIYTDDPVRVLTFARLLLPGRRLARPT